MISLDAYTHTHGVQVDLMVDLMYNLLVFLFLFSVFCFLVLFFKTSSKTHSVMCIAGTVGIRFSFLESKIIMLMIVHK